MILDERHCRRSLIALVFLACLGSGPEPSSAKMPPPVQLSVTEGWPEEGPWVNAEDPVRSPEVAQVQKPKREVTPDPTEPGTLNPKDRALSFLRSFLRF